MGLKLLRRANEAISLTVDIDVDADLTDAAVCDGYSFGMLWVPSTFDGTQIKFHTCATKGGTFTVLCDEAGTQITYTVAASTAVALPPELFGAAWFKIETVTDQTTTDTVFTVQMKG